jgi:hypothetical protein
MATWKGCGDGILCTVRKRDGAQVFACRVIWNGKQYTEQAGTSKLDAYALKNVGSHDHGTRVSQELSPCRSLPRVTCVQLA